MTTRPVLHRVSAATRDLGSCARMASSTASEIWSETLSGWPSETDSDVNRNSLFITGPPSVALARHFNKDRARRPACETSFPTAVAAAAGREPGARRLGRPARVPALAPLP